MKRNLYIGAAFVALIAAKTSLEKAIQQKVLALDKFYGYTPPDAGDAH
jgi:hypothetical protein